MHVNTSNGVINMHDLQLAIPTDLLRGHLERSFSVVVLVGRNFKRVGMPAFFQGKFDLGVPNTPAWFAVDGVCLLDLLSEVYCNTMAVRW